MYYINLYIRKINQSKYSQYLLTFLSGSLLNRYSIFAYSSSLSSNDSQDNLRIFDNISSSPISYTYYNGLSK